MQLIATVLILRLNRVKAALGLSFRLNHVRIWCLGAILLLVVFAGAGCATQEPLPFAYSTPVPPAAGAPSLTVLPTQIKRTGDENMMYDVLKLPECLDPVLVKELEGSGLFSHVELKTNGLPETGWMLQCRIEELRWEVPGYNGMVGTMFVVSILTGGVGGVIYGCTDADVLGHAQAQFNLTSVPGNQELLNRDYAATNKETKIKLVCDTPTAYREAAAKSFKKVMDQFESDVKQLNQK